MTSLEFTASLKGSWCGWSITPAWFLVSSKRTSGEPEYYLDG